MRTTFATQFYCRRSKANKKTNQAPLEVSISINGERKILTLPCRCNVDDFNKKRQPQEIKQLVNEWQKKIDDSVVTLMQEGIPLTASSLRDMLQVGGVKVYTIGDCFDEFLALKYKMIGIDITYNAYRKYEITRDLFYEFFDKDADITTITPAAIQNYYAELNKRYSKNTAASYMAKTKSVIYHFAQDNNRIHINPFQGIKILKEKPVIEFLTEDEVNKIANKEFSTPALQRIADVFLVQCYSGLSYIDLYNLKKDDIQFNDKVAYIVKPRCKTGVQYVSVLMPQAIPIFEKYNWQLPLISNQKTNSTLKLVALEAGIDKNIHTHLGRKTYACMLLAKNTPIAAVSKALGHSTIRTTESYYATLTSDSVINSISSVIG